MRKFGPLAVPLLLAIGIHCPTALSAAFTEEISRQDRIYHSRGEKRDDGYVVDRSLLSYTFVLPSGFDKSLADLTPGQRWLDIGAGRGRAVLDYYGERYDSMHKEGMERRGTKAHAVAMSIEDRREPAWHEVAARLQPGQITYWHGRRLREYSAAELGRFDLITDVLGGFSYTRDLTLYMRTVLTALKTGSFFYSLLQDVRFENQGNKPHYEGDPFLTEIRDAAGGELRICEWLKRITCVEVSCSQRPDWQPPVENYSVRKTCEDVNVPELELVHFQAGTPPERRFQLTGAKRKEPSP